MTAQPDSAASQAPVGLDDITLHLIALGASVAANADRAFRAHQARLSELGASAEDMIQAVNIALRVKGDSHQQMLALAEQSLVKGGGCCDGGCACEAAGGQRGDCGDDCESC